MQVQKISKNNYNTSFTSIILRDKRSFSKEFCDMVEEKTKGRKGGGFKSESLAGKRLIDEVIKYDYNTPEMKETYKHLLESQKNNPVNIYIDLFTADEGEIPLHPSDWFQKATVGKRTFKQSTTYFFSPQSRISFLKKACLYADILKLLRFGR